MPGGVMTLSRYMLDQARINTDYQVCCWVVVAVVVNSLLFLGCIWVECDCEACVCLRSHPELSRLSDDMFRKVCCRHQWHIPTTAMAGDSSSFSLHQTML